MNILTLVVGGAFSKIKFTFDWFYIRSDPDLQTHGTRNIPKCLLIPSGHSQLGGLADAGLRLGDQESLTGLLVEVEILVS